MMKAILFETRNKQNFPRGLEEDKLIYQIGKDGFP